MPGGLIPACNLPRLLKSFCGLRFYICMGDHVNKLFSERDTCQFITHALQTTADALDATVHQILTAQA